ncbi:MAG: hypothetical protein M1836_007616 [Candelina mexicana]|nr:MAG: hypothetical protein M1836_007616 [Candelina mexicana]
MAETNGVHANGINGRDGVSKPLMGPHSKIPVPADLDVLTAKSEDRLVEEIIESIRVSGGCVIRNMVGKDVIEQLERDFRPHIINDKSWNGDFWPPETRRVMGCLGKSKTFALRIIGNSIWQKVGEHFLSSTLKYNWVGDKQELSTSRPQLNNTVVFSIGPGAKEQVLHRDDPIYHTYNPAVAEHSLGRDSGAGFFVAGKKTTRQNGATRFVPGSHLWNYAEPPPSDDKCFYAELEPGDGFMVLSGCYHGGSANKTANEERLVYSTFTTRGWLRQEENQYLANDVEKVKELPVWLQQFTGYSLSKPFMGWVNLDDPIRVINPSMESIGDIW